MCSPDLNASMLDSNLPGRHSTACQWGAIAIVSNECVFRSSFLSPAKPSLAVWGMVHHFWDPPTFAADSDVNYEKRSHYGSGRCSPCLECDQNGQDIIVWFDWLFHDWMITDWFIRCIVSAVRRCLFSILLLWISVRPCDIGLEILAGLHEYAFANSGLVAVAIVL